MKKTFALLMTAAMILSAGCGNTVEQKANDIKQEAASEVKEAAKDVKQVADKVEQKADQVASNSSAANVDGKFSIGGVTPGMSLDTIKQALGEPTSSHDDEFTFSNGLMIETDDFGKVEEVKTRQAGVQTAAGIGVGMTEQNLFAAYDSPAATENDDGIAEHKYYSSDGQFKIEFDISNGNIVEIKCSFRD